MKYDFAIIGAGISGMTTAVILAQHGHSVALIEAAGRMGPVLRGFHRRGVYFDTGFHYTGGLDDGEILDIFFRYLGINDKIQKIPFDPDGFDLFRFPSLKEDFLFPCGYNRIQERFCSVFPKEQKGIRDFFHAVRESFQSRPYLNLDQDMSSFQKLRTVYGPSLKAVLDSLFKDRHLKRILSGHCYLHGVSPEEVPFSQHAAVVGSYYTSVHGLRGGGAGLVHAFEERLSEIGVDVFCGQRASAIDFSGTGHPEAVRLQDGTRILSRACISSIHPRFLLNLVPSGLFRPAYIRRLEALDESFSSFILYGVNRSGRNPLKKRNLFVFSADTKDPFTNNCPLEKRPLFISSATPENGRSESQGVAVICPSMANQTAPWKDTRAGHRPEGYQRVKGRIMGILKHRMEESCPEFKGAVEVVEGATPLTLRDFSNSPAGSLYGVKHRIGQYNPGPATRIKGLYLVGQAVVAPGVLGAVISAFLTCGSILDHDRIRKELNACR